MNEHGKQNRMGLAPLETYYRISQNKCCFFYEIFLLCELFRNNCFVCCYMNLVPISMHPSGPGGITDIAYVHNKYAGNSANLTGGASCHHMRNIIKMPICSFGTDVFINLANYAVMVFRPNVTTGWSCCFTFEGQKSIYSLITAFWVVLREAYEF